MTAKDCRREAERNMGEEWRKRWRIGARRRNGRCEVIVRKRVGPEDRPQHFLLAQATTWAQAFRQIQSGFSLEVFA